MLDWYELNSGESFLQYTLKQISQHLDAKLINEPSVEVIISGLNYVEQAKENDLTLIDK